MDIQLNTTAQTVLSTLFEKCNSLQFQLNKSNAAMIDYAAQFLKEEDRPKYSLELNKNGEFFLKFLQESDKVETKDSAFTVVQDSETQQ